MGFNTFGSQNKIYGGITPVWLDVDGVKQSGGTLDVSAYPLNYIIPAGTPIYLPVMGGNFVVLNSYQLAQDLAAGDVVAVFAANGDCPQAAAGLVVMAAPATYTSTGKAAAIVSVATNVDENGNSTISATIVAGSLGTGKAGDIYVEATADVVFDGTILMARTSPIPTCVINSLPEINFENE